MTHMDPALNRYPKWERFLYENQHTGREFWFLVKKVAVIGWTWTFSVFKFRSQKSTKSSWKRFCPCCIKSWEQLLLVILLILTIFVKLYFQKNVPYFWQIINIYFFSLRMLILYSKILLILDTPTKYLTTQLTILGYRVVNPLISIFMRTCAVGHFWTKMYWCPDNNIMYCHCIFSYA